MPWPRVRTSLSTSVSLMLAACISPENARVDPKAPVELVGSEADSLRSATLDDVLFRAPVTITDVPITTGLVRGVAKSSGEAVVSLYVKGSSAHRLRIVPVIGPGIPIDLPGEALGSGFFIHPSGYVISNEHVVRGSEEIVARTSDGRDYRLTVVARDPVYDLSLLRVVDPDRAFPILPMGDSAAVDVGEFVLAIGNPLGLGHTVTTGIVSQTDRSLSALANQEIEGREIAFLQTDAAINPGSSGGPLLTMAGAWIAVNTAGIPEAQGLNFAVPSVQVREFLLAVLAGAGKRVER